VKGWFEGSSSCLLKTLRRGEENTEDSIPLAPGKDKGRFCLYLIGPVVMESRQQCWWKACIGQKTNPPATFQ